jgi:hypothetical protein
VNRIVDKYGRDGCNTPYVLQDECARRRLRYAKINESQAEEAVKLGRVVIACFGLSKNGLS